MKWTKCVWTGFLLASLGAVGCGEDDPSPNVGSGTSSVTQRDNPGQQPGNAPQQSGGPSVVDVTRTTVDPVAPSDTRAPVTTPASPGTQCPTARCDQKIAAFKAAYPESTSVIKSCCVSTTACGITTDDAPRVCIEPETLGFQPFGDRPVDQGPVITGVTRTVYPNVPTDSDDASIRIIRDDAGTP